MLMHHHPQAVFKVGQRLHTNGFSHQCRHAVAPFVVQSFHQTSFAAAFVTRPMLPRSEELGVGFIKVGINPFSSIRRRQRKPQSPQTPETTVADPKADDLPCQARDRNPQIEIAPLEAIANHQLIEFQSVAFDLAQKRVGKVQARLAGFFWDKARIVVRATLKVRAMARCESRSCKAATIRTSFSALKARVLGWGVQLLPQAPHFKRCEPPRLKPLRNTRSLKPQRTQA